MSNRVAVIGGGAAGVFAAISVKNHHPDAEVTLFEKSQKLLSKVKVSGGGRCNVTNNCSSISQLCKFYPRGGSQLKKIFKEFNTTDTYAWFESRGVALYAQEDQRVFPKTDDSQTIIDCLMKELKKLQIQIVYQVEVKSLVVNNDQYIIDFSSNHPPQSFDCVIVASGGSPRRDGLNWLENLGHQIIDPVPSLFTFNMPSESIRELTGVSVQNALVSIQGETIKSEGPLLITHFGMSGPAILKLSSFGARVLYEKDYQFQVIVNWTAEPNQEKAKSELLDMIRTNPQKQISNSKLYGLPERLWLYLLQKAHVESTKKLHELSHKELNKLIDILCRDIYQVQGKTTFKEEFVTCGGVSLESIDLHTMQSKVCKNLYFAGEVLDIDALTGGFNFQAAWSTGYIAGRLKNL